MSTKVEPKITMERGQECLSPVEEAIVDCIRDGVTDYADVCAGCPRVLLAFDGRAKYSAIYSFIMQNIRERVPAIKNVLVAKTRGLEEIVLNDGEAVIRLRIKKVNRTLRTSNYKTKQQRLIDHQFSLYGEPEETIRLVFGYQLGPIGTELAEVHVIYPHDGIPLWARSVTRQAAPSIGTLPIPTPAIPLPAAKVRSASAKTKVVRDAGNAV